MGNDVIVRAAMKHDLDSVQKALELCYPKAGALEVKQYLKRGGMLQVASIGKLVVGFALVYKEADNLFINRIGVIPEYQRRGIGSDLLLCCVKVYGGTCFYLDVPPGRIGAVNFAKKHGFYFWRADKYVNIHRLHLKAEPATVNRLEQYFNFRHS